MHKAEPSPAVDTGDGARSQSDSSLLDGDSILVGHRSAPLVEAQFEVRLAAWRAYELPGGARVLAGMLEGTNSALTTSSIRLVDPISRIAITESGRRYHLHRPPV